METTAFPPNVIFPHEFRIINLEPTLTETMHLHPWNCNTGAVFPWHSIQMSETIKHWSWQFFPANWWNIPLPQCIRSTSSGNTVLCNFWTIILEQLLKQYLGGWRRNATWTDFATQTGTRVTTLEFVCTRESARCNVAGLPTLQIAYSVFATVHAALHTKYAQIITDRSQFLQCTYYWLFLQISKTLNCYTAYNN